MEYFELYLNVEYSNESLDAEVYKYIGMMYLKGQGTDCNVVKAYNYFLQSEDLEENDENEFWIGILSSAMNNENIENNVSDSWLKKASEKGNKNAKDCLNDINSKKKYVQQVRLRANHDR